MTAKLTYEEYHNLQGLFAELRYNLVVDSILEGNTPAWAYADRNDHPSWGLLWNRQDAMLLAGDPNSIQVKGAVAEIIREEIAPNAKSRGIPQLSLHYTPLIWEESMDALLGGFKFENARRRFYTTSRLRVNWRAGLPQECRLHRIDLPLLTAESLGNHEALLGWVRSFWSSVDQFWMNGLGYCVIKDDAVVSWCISVYVSGHHMEIGIATIPGEQRQGYASLVAAAFVEYCLANEITAHWHTWEDNRASIAVAQKVGFDKPMGYKVMRINL